MADTGRIILPGHAPSPSPVVRRVIVEELASGALRVVVSPESLGFGDAADILRRAVKLSDELREGKGIKLR